MNLTEKKIDEIWNSLDGLEIIKGKGINEFSRALRIAFAKAVETEVQDECVRQQNPDVFGIRKEQTK